MSTIPVLYEDDRLKIWASLNKSPRLCMLVDTGCSLNSFSKEDYESLCLTGYLSDADIVDSSSFSSYGGMRISSVNVINVKELIVGSLKLRNVRFTICPDYGGSTLFGMGAIGAFHGEWSINKEEIVIEDGNKGKSRKNKFPKDRVRSVKKIIAKLQKVVDDNGGKAIKFDYKDYIWDIDTAISDCWLIHKNGKTDTATGILEKLYQLLEKNIRYDLRHLGKGAFITGNLLHVLGGLYYLKNEKKKSKFYLCKAQKIYREGTGPRHDIECMLKSMSKNKKQ